MVYENFKCFGPYKRSDCREHVVLIHHDNEGRIDKRITCSYPKYIVKTTIGRYLLPNETVNHIDGDFTNNTLSNLRIVDRAEHCRSHVQHRKIVTKTCVICGKIFKTDNNKRITCGSKSCRGRCAHVLGHNEGNEYKRELNILTDSRDGISYIKSIID